jgi:hypothetical protein
MSNPWEATELFGKMLGEYTDNGYRQGIYEERERIIALLEQCGCDAEDNETCLCEYRPITRWAAIALIKGDAE